MKITFNLKAIYSGKSAIDITRMILTTIGILWAVFTLVTLIIAGVNNIVGIIDGTIVATGIGGKELSVGSGVLLAVFQVLLNILFRIALVWFVLWLLYVGIGKLIVWVQSKKA
ncbi:MAG: hypothetical protein J6Y65_02705 [Eggerthellaceae bacterium]|nr:hypothetical protein [Eggerthellaceae bacterium]